MRADIGADKRTARLIGSEDVRVRQLAQGWRAHHGAGIDMARVFVDEFAGAFETVMVMPTTIGLIPFRV